MTALSLVFPDNTNVTAAAGRQYFSHSSLLVFHLPCSSICSAVNGGWQLLNLLCCIRSLVVVTSLCPSFLLLSMFIVYISVVGDLLTNNGLSVLTSHLFFCCCLLRISFWFLLSLSSSWILLSLSSSSWKENSRPRHSCTRHSHVFVTQT